MEWIEASWGWIAGLIAAAFGAIWLRLKLRSTKEEGRAEGLVEGKSLQVKETLAQAELHRRLEHKHIDAKAAAEAQAAMLRARRDLAAIETPDELLRQLDDFEER